MWQGSGFSYYLTVNLPWHMVPILRTEGEEVTECLATISRPPDLQPEISKDSQFKDPQPVPCFPIVSAASSAKESILCAVQFSALNCSYRGAPQKHCLPGRGSQGGVLEANQPRLMPASLCSKYVTLWEVQLTNMILFAPAIYGWSFLFIPFYRAEACLNFPFHEVVET